MPTRLGSGWALGNEIPNTNWCGSYTHWTAAVWRWHRAGCTTGGRTTAGVPLLEKQQMIPIDAANSAVASQGPEPDTALLEAMGFGCPFRALGGGRLGSPPPAPPQGSRDCGAENISARLPQCKLRPLPAAGSTTPTAASSKARTSTSPPTSARGSRSRCEVGEAQRLRLRWSPNAGHHGRSPGKGIIQ
jgi:hypothetical protein